MRAHVWAYLGLQQFSSACRLRGIIGARRGGERLSLSHSRRSTLHSLDAVEMNNTSTTTITTADMLDCPVYAGNSDQWIEFFSFWVGGVLQSCIAIPGFVGKTRSSNT